MRHIFNNGLFIEVRQAFLPFPVETVSLLADHLNDAERDQANRFVNPEIGNRFRCARGLLRHLLGRRLGLPPRDLVFAVEPGGRPYLECASGRKSPAFSLSHSHDCIAIAISDSGPIGIDVEKIRAGTSMDAIIRRFFKPVEREAWEALPAAVREPAFLRLWTRKEAILKALGIGLPGLEKLTISLEDGVPRPVLALDGDLQAPSRWWCTSWTPAPGYLATLAATGDPAPVHPHPWPPPDVASKHAG